MRLLLRSKNLKTYYVYILTNRSKTLYTGVTNNLIRRIYEHKQKLITGFTEKYKIDRLVYYEETSNVEAAIAREKQIKGWLREKKIVLIESMNPEWKDLSTGWYEENF
jgi:putative endonuclease